MPERRRFQRFIRHDTVKFSLKESPQQSYDQSRLVDIGRGGLKFFALKQHPVGTRIIFEIKFPFLFPRVISLEGEVINIQKVVEGNIYKIGVKFVNLSSDAIAALGQMEKVMPHGQVPIYFRIS